MSLILKNARVVCRDWIRECDIKIDGSLISELGRNLPACEEDEIFDCKGATVMPGFIDTHLHGAYGCEMVSDDFDLEKFSRFEATEGVTGLAPTSSSHSIETLERCIRAVAKKEKEKKSGAKILGIHAEGPFLNPERKGGMLAEHIQVPSVEKLDRLIEASDGLLKLLTVAPELDGAIEVIKHAVKKGIKVSMGHTSASYDEAMAALDAGASQMTHTFNAARAFNHREPGVLGAALTDDRVKCEMICDFAHLHQATTKLIYKAKGADRINMISDTSSPAGLDESKLSYPGSNVRVVGKVILLEDGTISGSTQTLYDGVKNLASVGIPLVDIARMASYNPACTLGVEDKVGSIEVGKCADLVVLDSDMSIISVYIDGNKVDTDI